MVQDTVLRHINRRRLLQAERAAQERQDDDDAYERRRHDENARRQRDNRQQYNDLYQPPGRRPAGGIAEIDAHGLGMRFAQDKR